MLASVDTCQAQQFEIRCLMLFCRYVPISRSIGNKQLALHGTEEEVSAMVTPRIISSLQEASDLGEIISVAAFSSPRCLPHPRIRLLRIAQESVYIAMP